MMFFIYFLSTTIYRLTLFYYFFKNLMFSFTFFAHPIIQPAALNFIGVRILSLCFLLPSDVRGSRLGSRLAEPNPPPMRTTTGVPRHRNFSAVGHFWLLLISISYMRISLFILLAAQHVRLHPPNSIDLI